MMNGCRTGLLAVVGALAAAAIISGCAPARPRALREIASEVLGSLTPAALREVYHTPAFVVRAADGHGHTAVQDTELSAGSHVDDANLLVWAEGSADTVDGFRWTGRLLAESPYGFPPERGRLVIVLLKWSHGASAVAEHLNRAAQEAGATLLADMLEVHRRRHGADGHVGLAGFSAGTRVIQLALAGGASRAEAWRPEAFRCVDNVVFLGSSVGSDEVPPLEMIRRRFINFVNLRDTHFGDRATYVAAAGEKADPLKLLQQATIQRRPRFGASVAGFRSLPLLTAACQFDAAEALERSGAAPAVRQAFKGVNVPVPPALVPYNVFGSPILDDDLDDYVNLAPNHYIMTGRGPGGWTTLADFSQYRESAEEFVREHVAAAAMLGRLNRFDLKALPKGANPTGLPLPVPWAVFKGIMEPPAQPGAKPETPEPKPPASPDPKAGGAPQP